jgi:brefeldin A-resistance guanine nucleotide exchange factor 1
MDFESSFRMFLESFRLPGEAQKIARVMEAFGQEYYRQCPDVFHDADVVYVLAYSTILLNTDQHNPMVRSIRDIEMQPSVSLKDIVQLLPGFIHVVYVSSRS